MFRRRIRDLYRFLFRRAEVESEFNEELRSYLEIATDENLKRGLTAPEARRVARLQLGGAEQVREMDRAARVGSALETVIQDLRHVVRGLRSSPAFTAIVVVSMALAIGANSAIFSAVNGVLMRPLPYPEPDRLVRLYSREADGTLLGSSLPDFVDWQQNARSIETMGSFRTGTLVLEGESEAVRASVIRTTSETLRIIGGTAAHGRLFGPGDTLADAAPVVVLAYDLWRTRFGADPAVVGQTIRLGQPRLVPDEGILTERIEYALYTVIGVSTPMDGPLPGPHDLLVPWNVDADSLRNLRSNRLIPIVGRLAPGATIEDAAADMDRIYRALASEHGLETGEPVVLALHEATVAEARPALIALLGASGLILIVATSNVASMLLARGTARQPEMAMRSALGASRFRLARFLLTEAATLAILGGTIGLALAYAAVEVFHALEPAWLPRTAEISIGSSTLANAVTVTLVSALLFGLAPAFFLDDRSLAPGAKAGGAVMDRSWASFSLIATQVALSLVLLIGSGLMIRTFLNIQSVQVGFEARNTVVFSLGRGLEDTLLGRSGENRIREIQRYRSVIEQVLNVPGVTDATLTSQAPLTTSSVGYFGLTLLSGQRMGETGGIVGVVGVERNFFEFFDSEVIAGRTFRPADGNSPDAAVVVDALTAAALWPGEAAVGQRIGFFGAEAEVIGVVAPIRYSGLLDEMQQPKLFHLIDRTTGGAFGGTVLVRHEQDDASIMSAIRARLESDPTLAVSNLQSLDALYEPYLSEPRFYLVLMGALGALALTVSMVGVYGTVGYAVSRRYREVGIRVALGAGRTDVVRLFSGRVSAVLLIGLAAGLVLSVWFGRYVESLLYGTEPTDVVTTASAALTIIVMTSLATAIPLRRAVRIDPALTLRSE